MHGYAHSRLHAHNHMPLLHATIIFANYYIRLLLYTKGGENNVIPSLTRKFILEWISYIGQDTYIYIYSHI